MSDCIVRIEKMENGYEVEVIDPAIQEENNKPKSVWKDPWKSYAFTKPEQVTMFLAEVLPKLAPEKADDVYAAAFKAASSDDKKD